MKRWIIFDNDRKILNHYTTLFYCQSSTHLQHLNCKESKPFKCLNIKISYSFLLTSLGSTYFPKEYLFSKGVLVCKEKTTPRSIFFWRNYDWRLACIFGDAWTISKQEGPSCKKRNSTGIRLQILFKENMKILMKILPVSIFPKIT